jgi:PhnB protein
MPNPKLDPYLVFDGNCTAAFKFYEQVLAAQIEQLTTFGSSPMAAQVPASHADKVMHAKLRLDGQVLMASDAFPGDPHEGFKGFSLSLNYPSAAQASQVFAALAEGGKVRMPIAKTFWADAFGMLTDRFGVQWMVGCEKEA